MFRLTFAIDNLGDEALARQELGILLAALVDVNLVWLRTHPDTPSMADVLGRLVRYEDEPDGPRLRGEEAWRDIGTCLRPRRDGTRGAGNADLACWRVAELRARGEAASVVLESRPSSESRALFEHQAFVRTSSGDEDPSGGRGWRPAYARSRIAFETALFEGDRDRAASEEVLRILLRALTAIDVAFLRAHPSTIPILASGATYMEEPPGQEDWQDIPTILRMMSFDCDDGACARAAEMIVRDKLPAYADLISHKLPGGKMLYHIQVRMAGKVVEDPSRIAGMR